MTSPKVSRPSTSGNRSNPPRESVTTSEDSRVTWRVFVSREFGFLRSTQRSTQWVSPVSQMAGVNRSASRDANPAAAVEGLIRLRCIRLADVRIRLLASRPIPWRRFGIVLVNSPGALPFAQPRSADCGLPLASCTVQWRMRRRIVLHKITRWLLPVPGIGCLPSDERRTRRHPRQSAR